MGLFVYDVQVLCGSIEIIITLRTLFMNKHKERCISAQVQQQLIKKHSNELSKYERKGNWNWEVN